MGHSFLASDRGFGVHGNAIKKHEKIVNPAQYSDIVSTTTTLLKLGDGSWHIQDWKRLADNTCKKPLPCKVQSCKRIIISKTEVRGQRCAIKIRGEPNYRVDTGVDLPFTKRGKSWYTTSEPDVKPTGVRISDAKIADVKSLLVKHFGEEWEDLVCLKIRTRS